MLNQLSVYPFLKRYLFAAVLVTCLLASSALYGIRTEDAKVVALVKAEAKTSLTKDRIFRLWIAKHGGMYVLVGPDIKPNLFLTVPDRDIETRIGTLTLRNGATIMSELSRNKSGEFGLITRITALRYLNPANKPDTWEAKVLKRLSVEQPEYSETTQLNGKPHLRIMQAMLMEKPCLKCHSDLGIKLGELRGATGVAVPLAPYLALRNQSVARIVAVHGTVWILGMLGMVWSARISMQQKNERRRSKAELEKREAEVRLLLNSVSEGIVGVDLQGLCTFVNPMALSILGYSRAEQLIGANFHAVAHHTRADGTAYPSDVCPTNHALVQGRGSSVAHDIFWRADGSSVPVEFSSYPMFEEGQIIGAVVTFNNISRRLEAEAHIRTLSEGLEHSANGVLLTNEQGTIIYSNISFSSMSGYTSGEVSGKHPYFIGVREQSRDTYHSIKEAITQGKEWRGEFCARRKTGELFWVLSSISPIRDSQDRISHFIINMEDISDRKDAELLIEHLAYYDPLTDLPNRRLMRDRLDLAMKRSRRMNSPAALLYIDLDRFKQVNDTLGHQAGDQLLIEIARRFKSVLREDDTICRLGGDEFAVILHNILHEGDAAIAAEKLVEQAALPIHLEASEVFVGASIGIALYPRDANSAECLVKHADIAMYHAKGQGKSTYCFYNQELNTNNTDRLALESSLRHALERNEFKLVYQPKVDLASGIMQGVEALLRWQSPEYGQVPPARFISLAEETRQIIMIGEWVLKTACLQQVAWKRQGLNLNMAINLSAAQFHTPNLIERITSIFNATCIDPANLELELTESALVQSPTEAAEILEKLRLLGLGIAIDDFGTGYSSLSYLKCFPVTTLKIDRSFVRDLVTDSGDRAIAQSIVALGCNLQIKTVAEGVENWEQSSILKEMGCDLAQGYFYAKPMPPEEIPLVYEVISRMGEVR